MKKIIILAAFAGIICCLSGCSKKEKKSSSPFGDAPQISIPKAAANSQLADGENLMEGTNVNGFEIINEMTAFCPKEIYAPRAGVAYGTVKHETYYSKTCGMERGFSILLPASYDGQKKYPVIYFQHGIFGDEYSMTGDPNNNVKEITANLAADGKAKELIMVFGNMYAADDPEMKPAFDSKAVLPYDNFINELVNDLMPYIESHYSVLTGRENTAVCGFSMGGRESLYIGLSRPDLFAYIGAISPAPGLVPGKDNFMTHEGTLTEEQVHFPSGMPLPDSVLICCGTKDSVVGKFPKSYHQLFEKNGIEHIWFEILNADHDNNAIRAGLAYFIQGIF